MRTLLIKITFVIVSVLAFSACNDKMGETDTRLAPVNALVEPLNERDIALQTAASATVYFEWEYADASAGGTSVYYLAFDKADGDFSNPVYLVKADNNGYNNHATLTHKQVNKIAGMMEIQPQEKGSFKWTVFSTKGMKSVKAMQEHAITVTRLAGLEDPLDLYITGAASEGGDDLSKAQKMKSLGSGAYEGYTKLKAGEPFYFADSKTGIPSEFSISEEGVLKEGGTSTVAQDGVYRIVTDFETGACSITLVTRIGFFFSPTNEILFELPYVGYGVFKATQQTVTFKQEDWGRDERYKFRMFVKENGGNGEEKELEWGTLNQTDARPNASSPESYYYLQLLTNVTQWDNKWKLMGDFDGVPADYTIYLTADMPYTHFVSK